MKRTIGKKMYIVISVALLLGAAGCGKQEIKEEGNEKLEQVLGDVQDEINEIKEQSSNTAISEYVTPAETDFSWTEVEGGVALDGYHGEAIAIYVPAQLGGKNVVEIAMGAFNDVANVLEGIVLPDTVRKVDEKAFLYCTVLKEINLGKGVITLGDHAIEGCVSLMNVTGGESLESTGFNCFANCQSLKKINLPEGLKELGAGTFCLSGIEQITIPGTVETIGKACFSTCLNLKSVVIEEGVLTLDEKVFEGCENLESVEIPASVTTITGLNMFIDTNDNVVIYGVVNSEAEKYAVEKGLTFKEK